MFQTAGVTAVRGFAGLGDTVAATADDLDYLLSQGVIRHGYTVTPERLVRDRPYVQQLVAAMGYDAALADIQRRGDEYVAAHPPGTSQLEDVTAPTPGNSLPTQGSGTGKITLPIIGPIDTKIALLGAGLIAWFFLQD